MNLYPREIALLTYNSSLVQVTVCVCGRGGGPPLSAGAGCDATVIAAPVFCPALSLRVGGGSTSHSADRTCLKSNPGRWQRKNRALRPVRIFAVSCIKFISGIFILKAPMWQLKAFWRFSNAANVTVPWSTVYCVLVFGPDAIVSPICPSKPHISSSGRTLACTVPEPRRHTHTHIFECFISPRLLSALTHS